MLEKTIEPGKNIYESARDLASSTKGCATPAIIHYLSKLSDDNFENSTSGLLRSIIQDKSSFTSDIKLFENQRKKNEFQRMVHCMLGNLSMEIC